MRRTGAQGRNLSFDTEELGVTTVLVLISEEQRMKSSRPSNILLFAVSILQSTFAETEKIVDPRPGFPTDDAEDEDNVFVQARIIGGTNAREDRYPYFVSMVDVTGRHTCGGSLIAPDIVLSAGHCQGATRRAHVGRWNRRDPGDDYEDIGIRFPEYPHPGYSDDGFPNDFLIIKLESQSTKPILRLNQNPALPRGNVEDEVTVIGFGNTVSGVTSMSSVLKEAGLEYIPNSICELSKDPGLDLSYQNQIIDSMLCAGDEGEDSCQGDSGGPLIVSGGSATDDVLVGIISWYVLHVPLRLIQFQLIKRLRVLFVVRKGLRLRPPRISGCLLAG